MQRMPRLHLAMAQSVVSRLPMTLTELEGLPLPEMEACRFAPTGGPKATRHELISLREALWTDARAAGYPGNTLAARQSFDRTVAQRLAQYGLPKGEMLRADVWAWLSIHLAAALVAWRFPGERAAPTKRFAGIVQRNTLGRLWLRGMVFDRGTGHPARWELVDTISEDAAVGILERTGISSDWRLARAIGERWLKSRTRGEKADHLLREAIKRIGVEVAMRETGALDDDDLDGIVDACFVDELPAKPWSS